MSKIDELFETPRGLPQFEREAGQTLDVADLLMSAPSWNENAQAFAPELLHLIQSYASVRSALMFVTEVCKDYELRLRTAPTWEETCRCQGAVQLASNTAASLLYTLKEAQETKDTQNELEES